MTPLTSFTRFRRQSLAALAAVLIAGFGTAAQAQFALAVVPPRFELNAKPGDRLRDIIELSQAGAKAGTYVIKTADWTLRPDGTVEFSDELAPGSCRPWVTIERREVNVTAGRPYRFRFEVAPPPDAPATECRFAVMIEGKESAASGQVPINLSGRIGVIVYVAVGNVAPVLELAGTAVQAVNGTPTPVLKIRNTGNAHGRLNGFLNGTDGDGATLELQAGTAPIMAGETRDIPLTASKPGNPDAAVTVRYPLQVKGKLEWGRSGSIPLDQRFSP